jgi:hypothetical protein
MHITFIKYLGTTETNQNFINEEVKSRLNSGNDCYHSDQKLLSSLILSMYIKIRLYRSCNFACFCACVKLNLRH